MQVRVEGEGSGVLRLFEARAGGCPVGIALDLVLFEALSA